MTQPAYPKITFGIIVLNGEPFTRYCLKSIYPFAHEIIVVEGGHENAVEMCTPDGHSIDGTLEALWRFKQEDDPDNKLQIITRDAFWPMKDELGRYRTHQSRAYAERATGDYLWQIDIDEFYHAEDIKYVVNMLKQDPAITAVSFQTQTFWGDIAYTVDSWPLRRGLNIHHRLFKWGNGYRYVTHEPPTVYDANGIDVHSLNWVKGETLAKRGIYLYHYAFLFPWEVYQKVRVYQSEKKTTYAKITEWSKNNYFRLGDPYRVYSYYQSPSWLERFSGKHPQQIVQMMEDVHSGKIKAELRQTDDIERLLNSRWYIIRRTWLKYLDYINRFLMGIIDLLIKLFLIIKNCIPPLRKFSFTQAFYKIVHRGRQTKIS